MEEEIYTLLSSAVSFPVTWGTFKSDIGLPRAEMHVVSGVEDYTMNTNGLVQGRIQVNVYGETFREAVVSARLINDALSGYKGGVILGAFRDSTRDQQSDDNGLVPYRSYTYSITYRD